MEDTGAQTSSSAKNYEANKDADEDVGAPTNISH